MSLFEGLNPIVPLPKILTFHISNPNNGSWRLRIGPQMIFVNFGLSRNRFLISQNSGNLYLFHTNFRAWTYFRGSSWSDSWYQMSHWSIAGQTRMRILTFQYRSDIDISNRASDPITFFQTRVRSDIKKFWGPKFPIRSWKSARMPFPGLEIPIFDISQIVLLVSGVHVSCLVFTFDQWEYRTLRR